MVLVIGAAHCNFQLHIPQRPSPPPSRSSAQLNDAAATTKACPPCKSPTGVPGSQLRSRRWMKGEEDEGRESPFTSCSALGRVSFSAARLPPRARLRFPLTALNQFYFSYCASLAPVSDSSCPTHCAPVSLSPIRILLLRTLCPLSNRPFFSSPPSFPQHTVVGLHMKLL